MQRSAFDSPGEITQKNWLNHLGDERSVKLSPYSSLFKVIQFASRYYRAYFKFFADIAIEKGLSNVLEAYFLHSSANWNKNAKDEKDQPQMLNRLLSGVLHPFIHVGYACEFGALGMLAEGTHT